MRRPSGLRNVTAPLVPRSIRMPPSCTSRWWRRHRSSRLSSDVPPPSAQCVMWWASQWRAVQPGKRQRPSRALSARRMAGGIDRVLRPTSSADPSGPSSITTTEASHARRRDVSYETLGPDLRPRAPRRRDSPSCSRRRTWWRLRRVASPSGEVVGAEILVRDVASEHVPDGSQEGVLDGADGFLRTLPRLHAVIQRVVVAALGAARRPRGFVQRGAQPVVRLAGGGSVPFACTLVRAGTDAGPRGQMAGGRETRHVRADLRQDRLGGAGRDARRRAEQRVGVGDRREGLRDLDIERRDLLPQVIDRLELLTDEKRVVRAEAALDGLLQREPSSF